MMPDFPQVISMQPSCTLIYRQEISPQCTSFVWHNLPVLLLIYTTKPELHSAPHVPGALTVDVRGSRCSDVPVQHIVQ